MNRRMRKRGRSLPHLEIPLTPLIDTVLVLLITFMVAMPVMQNEINIELPSSSANDDSKGESRNRSITVFIDKKRQLFLNEKLVKEPVLLLELEKLLQGEQEQVVMVKADRSVEYGEVVRVVDDIKYLGGVRYVALATQQGRA